MAETDSYFKRLVCGPAFSPGGEMKYEVARLASFTTWPPWARVRPTELASVGMYYTGNSDHVSCFSCGSDMGEWQPEQRPETEHRRHSPGCALVLGRDTDNVPFPAVPDPCAPEADGEDSSDARAENQGHSGTIGTGSSTLPQDTSCILKGLDQLFSIMPELRDVNQRVDSDSDLQGKSFAEQMELLMADDPLPRSVPHSVVRSLSTPQAPENSRTFTSLPSSTPATGRADVDMTRVNREGYRLGTFHGWPEASFVGPPELAKNGFYYLGSLDRVKCAFCNGTLRNWRPEDDVKQEHRRHFRFCPFVRGMDVNNITLEAELQQTSGANAMEQDPEALGVLTERPKHAAYAIEASRAATFTNWPKSNVISPSVLARAGFFYIGYGDNCKCFFCDGGLRNWEPSDDPWSEHARWFPQCGFLKMCKGEDYIRSIQAHYDDRTPASSGGDIAVPSTPTAGVPGVMYQVDPASVRARMASATVQTVLQMDFPKSLIMKVIEQRLRTEGNDFPTSESLIQAVFDAQEEEERGSPRTRPTRTQASHASSGAPTPSGPPSASSASSGAAASGASEQALTKSKRKRLRLKEKKKRAAVDQEVRKPGEGEGETPGDPEELDPEEPESLETQGAEGGRDSDDDQDPGSLAEENERMKEQRMCKVCMDSEVNIVFLPCGHLVCCGNCAPALRLCPICRQSIRGTVRVFLS